MSSKVYLESLVSMDQLHKLRKFHRKLTSTGPEGMEKRYQRHPGPRPLTDVRNRRIPLGSELSMPNTYADVRETHGFLRDETNGSVPI